MRGAYGVSEEAKEDSGLEKGESKTAQQREGSSA